MLLFVIVFLLWGLYNMLQSDLFNLKKIEVEGNIQLEDREIIKAAKLLPGKNIFKYNLNDIENNVKMHSYIKEVRIKRKIPSSMIIHVKERNEYAIIRYIDSYIYIDEEEVILKVTDSNQSSKLIVISGVEFESFEVGEHIHVNNHQQLAAVLDFVEAARITSIDKSISQINIAGENVRLLTIDGNEVLLGEEANPAYVAVALREVLEHLKMKNITNAVITMENDGQISVHNRSQ